MITPPFVFKAPSWRAKAFIFALSRATLYEKMWVREAAEKLNRQDWENSVFTFDEVRAMAKESDLQTVISSNNMRTVLDNLCKDQMPMASSSISANLIQWAIWFSSVAQDDKFKLSQYAKTHQGCVVLNIKDTKEHVYLKSEDSRVLWEPQAPRNVSYVLWQWSWGGTILDSDLPPTKMKEQLLMSRILNRRQANRRFIPRENIETLQVVHNLLDLKRYWEAVPAYEAVAHLYVALKGIDYNHKNNHSLTTEKQEGDFNKIKKLCHQRGAMNMLEIVSGDDIASKALALNCAGDEKYREDLTRLGLLPIEKSVPLMLYPELNGRGFVYSFDLLFNEVSYRPEFLEPFSDEQVKIILQRWLEEDSCSKMQDFVNTHAARLTPEILSSVNAEKTMPLLTVLKNNKLTLSEKVRIVTTLLERGANPRVQIEGISVVDYAQKFSKYSVCVPVLKEYALRMAVDENRSVNLKVKPKFKI